MSHRLRADDFCPGDSDWWFDDDDDDDDDDD
jgi:hypothetical protein